jgi:hypothetical protein
MKLVLLLALCSVGYAQTTCQEVFAQLPTGQDTPFTSTKMVEVGDLVRLLENLELTDLSATPTSLMMLGPEATEYDPRDAALLPCVDNILFINKFTSVVAYDLETNVLQVIPFSEFVGPVVRAFVLGSDIYAFESFYQDNNESDIESVVVTASGRVLLELEQDSFIAFSKGSYLVVNDPDGSTLGGAALNAQLIAYALKGDRLEIEGSCAYTFPPEFTGTSIASFSLREEDILAVAYPQEGKTYPEIGLKECQDFLALLDEEK